MVFKNNKSIGCLLVLVCASASASAFAAPEELGPEVSTLSFNAAYFSITVGFDSNPDDYGCEISVGNYQAYYYVNMQDCPAASLAAIIEPVYLTEPHYPSGFHSFAVYGGLLDSSCQESDCSEISGFATRITLYYGNDAPGPLPGLPDSSL